MSRKGSWYFDGYKRVEKEKPNGKMGSELVYVGEYYGFNGGKKEMTDLKKKTLFLSIASLILYFYAQFNPSTGGMVHWMAIPSLLSLIPIMFLVMGFINFLPAKEKWEIRVYYAGYRRLYRSSIGTLVFLCIWAVMEAVYVLFNIGDILDELVYFLCVIASTILMAFQVRLIKAHPAVVVQGPKIE